MNRDDMTSHADVEVRCDACGHPLTVPVEVRTIGVEPYGSLQIAMTINRDHLAEINALHAELHGHAEATP